MYLPVLVCVSYCITSHAQVKELEDEQQYKAEAICVTRLSNMVEIKVIVIRAVLFYPIVRLGVTEGNLAVTCIL